MYQINGTALVEHIKDLQITKLSYNAAIVERSGVAGKLMQVSSNTTHTNNNNDVIIK